PVDGEIVKKVGQSVSCNQKSDWSSEELCFCVRAQRVFGNRWTEIQRKDKAVNRFTRLRVKRAKHETMASENNSNNKIMFFLDGSCTPANMKLLLPIEQGSSSMIAALHYTLCLHSELFMSITRWKLSSLPHELDKRKLTILFDNPNIWYSLILHLQKMEGKSLLLDPFYAEGIVRQKIQRHGTVKGTMDVKELVLLLAKNSMNHQSLLLVKDCATPPALKKEVLAAGERDKEGREVGEKKTEGG
ncbi:hypothetical protein HID58_018923, partial [Brassica napus]